MYKLPLFYKIEENIFEVEIEILKKFNKKNILILTEKNIFELLKEKIFLKLEKEFNVDYIFLKDNTLKNAFEISNRMIETNKELIIGVGGGRVLDLAKYVSYISKLDLLSIPTTIANDGIASPIAVLKDEKDLTRSLGARVPTGILIDLEIIKKAPKEYLKAGIGDILSNYTSLFDWKLAAKNKGEDLNDFAYLISKTAFNSVFYYEKKSIYNEKFIKQICESIVLSGISMEIAGSSRPCSGSEHLFSHYIDYYYNKKNLHGYQVALGAVVSSYLQNRDYKKLILFLKELKIDISPTSLNISKEEYLKAWKNCKSMRKNRFTVLDTIEFDDKKLLKIYDEIEEEFIK